MRRSRKIHPCDRAFTSHCRVSCIPPPPLLYPTVTSALSHHLSCIPQSPLLYPPTSPISHHHLTLIPPPPPAPQHCVPRSSSSGTGPVLAPTPRHQPGSGRAVRAAPGERARVWGPHGSLLPLHLLPTRSRTELGRPRSSVVAVPKRDGRSSDRTRGQEGQAGGAGAMCGCPAQGPQRAPSQASRPPTAPGLCQPGSPQNKQHDHGPGLPTATARRRPNLIFSGKWPRQGAPPLGAAPRARPRLSDGSHKGKAPSNPPGPAAPAPWPGRD